MPLFDYKCATCGEVTEHLVANSEVKSVPCKCGGQAEQTLSAGTAIFTGGGWYRDSYDKSSSKVKD